MTAAATDTEILSGLDFDHEVPCEWPEHGKPAKHLVILPCGCPPPLACETCRDNLDSYKPEGIGRCHECFAGFRRDEIRMVPLP